MTLIARNAGITYAPACLFPSIKEWFLIRPKQSLDAFCDKDVHASSPSKVWSEAFNAESSMPSSRSPDKPSVSAMALNMKKACDLDSLINLYGFSYAALDSVSDKQSQPWNQTPNKSNRRFSRWVECSNTRMCQTAPCSNNELGSQSLHEHGLSFQSGGWFAVWYHSWLTAGLPNGWIQFLRKRL